MSGSGRAGGSRRSTVVGRASAALLALLALCGGAQPAEPESESTKSPARAGGEPHWIWSPEHTAGEVPVGRCFFRRVFQVEHPEHGQVVITCDDRYELFVNGRRVGGGERWQRLSRHDITRYLVPGRNAVAVRAENTTGGSAGLVARVIIKQTGHTDVAYSTDSRWKTSLREQVNWQKPQFDDTAWMAAQSLGEFGCPPWGSAIEPPEGVTAGRFKTAPAFRVERVASPQDTGSLISMAFNEWGDLLAGREQGPLVLVRDRDEDGAPESVSVYCEGLKNCQGILPLNGQVYAVGEGPEGAGLYRLGDEDRNDQAEQVELLLKFPGGMGEHGPHTLVLGPDGFLYLLLGNHAQVEKPYAATGPYREFYEGDLVQPRDEDPSGHAAGIKTPGGVIVRTDPHVKSIERFAGGLRNPYDLAFGPQGELFTCDSDTETDDGLPWYRPNRVLHVTAGGEFGWRSGSAAWPDYYHDSLPAALDLGRGSPTGMVFYSHWRYPPAYRNVLFMGDWSRGRIVAVRLEPGGGSYKATSEVFLEGQPLNVTDLCVGRDGWLYFATGGRGTEGGIYRVVWDGKPPQMPAYTGVLQALRQPQISSAWSREQLAILKDEMGSQWGRQLAAVAASVSTAPEDRIRALELLQWLGPYPSTALLTQCSTASSELLRAKAAYLMGIHHDAAVHVRLVELLVDRDPGVRRAACEALARSGTHPPLAAVLPLLADRHRHVAFAARTLLVQMPRDEWQGAVLEHRQAAVFLQGATALLALEPDAALVEAILDRSSELMGGFLSDDEFLGLLRVLQLALIEERTLRDQPSAIVQSSSEGSAPQESGGDQAPQLVLSGDELPERLQALARQLSEEYPSLEPRINRELVRLLVHLQEPSVTDRYLSELRGAAPQIEKIHLALHARFLKDGWTTKQKLALLEFFEQARTGEGAQRVGRYVELAERDFFPLLTADEERQVLADATRFPGAALRALLKLPPQPGEEVLTELGRLDARLAALESDSARRLRVGIVAVLARSGEPRALEYLREVFEKEPTRRSAVAMGLAQEPGGENWPLLVRSLGILEGVAAQEVLTRLAQVRQAPDEPEALRQAILCGLRLGNNGGHLAARLLEHWTGQTPAASDASAEAALAAWQQWFREKYPGQPEPALPVASSESKWTLEELLSYVASGEARQVDPVRGELVFEKAQCVKCHRFGNRGETIGPDLTTIARRFHPKEILESVLFPSHVISDQYASRTVVTTGGLAITGLVAPSGEDAVVVLDATGKKTTIAKENIEEIAPHATSAMPEGLFNNLTLEEIADLMAYLNGGQPALAGREGSRR